MSWSLVGSAGALLNTTTSPGTANCGQASTAGNLLICRVMVVGTVTPTLPTGWVLRRSKVLTTPNLGVYVFEYVNNPGSISSVSITFTGTRCVAQVCEYTTTGVTKAYADQSGVAGGVIASPLTISTDGALASNNELAISFAAAQFSAATITTLTQGTGFTQRLAWNNGSSQQGHASFDDSLDTGASSAGSGLTDAVTLSATGTGNMAGVIVTYSLPVVVTAPLSGLSTATDRTSSDRSGTATAPLAPAEAAGSTSSARNGGTVTAALTLHVSVSVIVQAPALPLGTAATGVSRASGGSALAATQLSLTVAITGVAGHHAGGSLSAFLLLSTPRYPLHFGGAVADVAAYGGSLTLTAAHWTYDGTAVLAAYNGTAILATDDGLLSEWTMTPINITLAEFNDEQLSVTITSGGSPVNLTGFTVDAWFKTKAGIADTDPSTIHLSSSGISPAITITNAALGQCVIAITSADLQNNNIGFYRIDAVDATSKRNTAIYGTVVITLL